MAKKDLKYFIDNEHWSNLPRSIFSLFLILITLLGSVEVIISTTSHGSLFTELLTSVYNITSVFFIIEWVVRFLINVFISDKYEGWKGKIRYIFSFYCIVDLVSFAPFLIQSILMPSASFLRVFDVFRFWRLIRYISPLGSMSKAFRDKRNEIAVSLFLLLLLSLTNSSLLYYVELDGAHKSFSSVIDTFFWSIAKYMGDHGGIAHTIPQTSAGQFLATLNGLIGIAFFALPTGILVSGFLHQLDEKKKEQRFKEDGNKIYKLINERRSCTIDYIQSKLLLTEGEIIKAVRNSRSLHFRSLKSDSARTYNDIKVIESFPANTSYGCLIKHNTTKSPNSSVLIVNTCGYQERSVSHFTRMIAKKVVTAYISREYLEITKQNKKIKSTESVFYKSYPPTSKLLPNSFMSFINDLYDQVELAKWVVIIQSAASGRFSDFHFTCGLSKNATNFDQDFSTISQEKVFLELIKISEIKAKEVSIISENKSNAIYSFNVSSHEQIGRFSDNELGVCINKNTQKNVLTIWVNIEILTGDLDRYNAGINYLSSVISELSKL